MALHFYRFRDRLGMTFPDHVLPDHDCLSTEGRWVYHCADEDEEAPVAGAGPHPISEDGYLPDVCYDPKCHELHYLGRIDIDGDAAPLKALRGFFYRLDHVSQREDGQSAYHVSILGPLKRRIMFLLAKTLQDDAPLWVDYGVAPEEFSE